MPTIAEAFAQALADRQAGNFQAAEQLYRQIVLADPTHPESHCYLGGALMDLGQWTEAETCFQQALQLRPHFPEALNDLAYLYATQQRWVDAVETYKKALRLRPHFPEAAGNLGLTFQNMGLLDEAVVCCQEAVRMRSDAVALNRLAHALLPLGRLDEALACLREAVRQQPNFVQARSNLLFALNYDPKINSASLFAEHCQWDAIHGQQPPLPPASNVRNPDRRLRVGYVSPDLHEHPVARFLEPILGHHDPDRVEVFCYAEDAHPDAMTARLRSLAHHWRSTGGLKDSQVAQLVRQDAIDILVDLAGHTDANRLGAFALKPAPVQVTYLGYPNTTGLRAIDYRLTDPVADPPGEAPAHSEQLVRLPDCFCCFQPPDDVPQGSALPAGDKENITFGALHHQAKLNPAVLDLWSAILKTVPASKLLICRDTLTPGARSRLQRQFAERGIGPDQLDLRQGPGIGKRHWDVYHEIDITLDPFPWGGHTTACDSLWMGVPVVTLRGSRHAGWMVASVLTGVGLSNWIADTPEEYVALAVRQAHDREGRRELRARLRQKMRMSPLCDGSRFTQNLEDAYRSMWHQWCAAPRM